MTDRKQQIQSAYDNIAESYHKKTEENEDGMNETVLSEFISQVEPNDTILDAGCGGNPITFPRASTIGIDISRGQLDQYKDDVANLFQGDITRLPFKTDSFQGATAFYSLIHIPLDEHQTVINELARVLKTGSPVLLVEGTEEWIGSNESWLETNEEMHWEIAGREATVNQLEAAGFTIQTIEPVIDTLGDNDGTKLFFLATAP